MILAWILVGGSNSLCPHSRPRYKQDRLCSNEGPHIFLKHPGLYNFLGFPSHHRLLQAVSGRIVTGPGQLMTGSIVKQRAESGRTLHDIEVLSRFSNY